MERNLRELTRGDTRLFYFKFWENKSTSTPLDLTGWKLYLTIKTKPDLDDTDALAVYTQCVDTHLNDVNGETQLLFDSSTIVDPREYYYDFQLVNSDSSTVLTPLRGKIPIKPDITRRIADA